MKKAIKYSIIVCIVSWIYAAIIIFGIGIKNVNDSPFAYSILAAIYMLFPMLCAMVIQFFDRERFSSNKLLRFKMSSSWIAAWFLPVSIVLLTILVDLIIPGIEFNKDVAEMFPYDKIDESQRELVANMMSPLFLILVTVVSGLLAGITINAVFAFGEEYGWRSYMVNALRKKNFTFATIFTGLVWGFWHFPLILIGHNYPQHPIAGVFMMVLFCILISFIELYLVLKAKSVYPAAIFHGTINALGGLNIILIKGGGDLLNGITGLSGFIVMSIIVLMIFVFDKYIFRDNIFNKTIEEVLEDGER